MKPVSELYNQYPDSDIYVIGTGASLRTYPILRIKSLSA